MRVVDDGRGPNVAIGGVVVGAFETILVLSHSPATAEHDSRVVVGLDVRKRQVGLHLGVGSGSLRGRCRDHDLEPRCF